MFGYELVEMKDEITKLQSQKKDALGANWINEQAQQVINWLRAKNQVGAIMVDDPYAITNKYLDIILKWKMDSEVIPGAVIKNKRIWVTKWIELRNAAANDDDKTHHEWTKELEAELQQVKNEDLTLKDNAVGREKKKRVNNLITIIVADLPTKKRHSWLAWVE